jgi:hypothetical protein
LEDEEDSMNTSYKRARAVLVCAAVTATGVGTLRAAEPQHKAENLCRTIQANAPWQGTGVSVSPGQFVCVAAHGLWSHGPQGIQAMRPFYGPQGFGKDEPNLIPEVVSRTGALVGRIGTNAPFLIEKQLCFIPGSPGELRLQMNDEPGIFDDNQGSMQVRIVKWADFRWAPDRIDLDPQLCKAR